MESSAICSELHIANGLRIVFHPWVSFGGKHGPLDKNKKTMQFQSNISRDNLSRYQPIPLNGKDHR